MKLVYIFKRINKKDNIIIDTDNFDQNYNNKTAKKRRLKNEKTWSI